MRAKKCGFRNVSICFHENNLYSHVSQFLFYYVYKKESDVYFKNLSLLFSYLFYLMVHEISLFSI